jgi:hypothetical protein
MYSPFVVTGILQQEIADKVSPININIIGDLLNENLQFSHYGAGLVGISFFYIVLPPDNQNHREYSRYTGKDRLLHLQFRLPYDLVEQLTREQVLPIMAQKYLQALKEVFPKKKIENFDYASLLKDMEHLFEQQGWLEKAVSIG